MAQDPSIAYVQWDLLIAKQRSQLRWKRIQASANIDSLCLLLDRQLDR